MIFEERVPEKNHFQFSVPRISTTLKFLSVVHINFASSEILSHPHCCFVPGDKYICSHLPFHIVVLQSY